MAEEKKWLNEDFNLVDFYNSLEQNYKQSPEGEAGFHEASGFQVSGCLQEAPGLLLHARRTHERSRDSEHQERN